MLGWGSKERGYESSVVAEVVQVIEAKSQQYPAPAKMVVYCSNKVAGEKLAMEIGCDIYHRDIDTEDGKARRLKQMDAEQRPQHRNPGSSHRSHQCIGLGY